MLVKIIDRVGKTRMEERLIYENKSPDVIVTTERVIVNGKVIPVGTPECSAVFSSTGIIFKKNEFYIAYSEGTNLYAQGNRITYIMGTGRNMAERLREYDVHLQIVTKSLSKSEMAKLKADINGAIKKASAWQQAAIDSQVQSERDAISSLKRL